jgi:Na+-translocating ferredoxin:NAD+ oxidoreductase RnfC subunit
MYSIEILMLSERFAYKTLQCTRRHELELCAIVCPDHRTRERGYTDKHKEDLERKERRRERHRADRKRSHDSPDRSSSSASKQPAEKKKKIYATDDSADPPWLKAAR